MSLASEERSIYGFQKIKGSSKEKVEIILKKSGKV
jgi:hypothetical protein